ncbi:MAG: hypothetical protein JWP97_6250 [Labilithrix sp.]|nr:hypothetical protein [Labilithrix sp.]
MARLLPYAALGLGAGLWVAAAACSSEDPAALRRSTGQDDAGANVDGGDNDTDSGLDFPFEPVGPSVYVPKVKNLLTGLPPTAAELSAVLADPNALKGLIDTWLATPEGQAKLGTFLGLAFQQSQFLPADLADMLGSNRLPGSGTAQAALFANVKESFERTALGIVAEGRPFTETVTSSTYLMTPALMSLLALLDERRIDDKGTLVDKWFVASNQMTALHFQNTTPIPFADSINPANANYLSFYTASNLGTGCPSRDYPANRQSGFVLAQFLFGTLDRTATCTNGANITDAPIVAADYTTWKKVTVRKPAAGEATTRFFDVAKLRTATELVLDTPRVGFFSTAAFLANWRTNTSNLARVTVNQTLIVALGASFEPDGTTIPISESGLDTQHSDPSSACYACHKLLDPMRGYFQKNLTLNYHEQVDPAQLAITPSFSFAGVTATGSTLEDLARTIASHPRFPGAWVQKLCFYADSAACSEDDPEFVRIADAFKAGSFDFRALVRDLFSSPLVTGAARTKTFHDREVVVSVSRYDHLCRALTVRLGVNACALDKGVQVLANNLPRDGYARASEQPVLTSDVSMFYRTGTENLCRAVADQVVGTASQAKKYSDASRDAALSDFVANVMALPSSDPRSAPALQILKEHYDAAVATGASPVDSLKSTFVLACTSPTAVSIGL